VFVIRWFACSCAFAGAGWFGLWVYEATRQGGWDSGFGWIIGTAAVGGLVTAVVARARGRRGETR
jgi:hypothetical protein